MPALKGDLSVSVYLDIQPAPVEGNAMSLRSRSEELPSPFNYDDQKRMVRYIVVEHNETPKLNLHLRPSFDYGLPDWDVMAEIHIDGYKDSARVFFPRDGELPMCCAVEHVCVKTDGGWTRHKLRFVIPPPEMQRPSSKKAYRGFIIRLYRVKTLDSIDVGFTCPGSSQLWARRDQPVNTKGQPYIRLDDGEPIPQPAFVNFDVPEHVDDREIGEFIFAYGTRAWVEARLEREASRLNVPTPPKRRSGARRKDALAHELSANQAQAMAGTHDTDDDSEVEEQDVRVIADSQAGSEQSEEEAPPFKRVYIGRQAESSIHKAQTMAGTRDTDDDSEVEEQDGRVIADSQAGSEQSEEEAPPFKRVDVGRQAIGLASAIAGLRGQNVEMQHGEPGAGSDDAGSEDRVVIPDSQETIDMMDLDAE